MSDLGRTERSASEQSNVAQARKIAREVVSRDGTTLVEALLADAIGHLADEVERTRNHLENLETQNTFYGEGGLYGGV